MKPMRTIEDVIAHFWERVDRSGGPDACWPWLAAVDGDGYGLVNPGKLVRQEFGNILSAHRLAWLFTYGQINKKKKLLHRCDNPPCCNPRHLREGTQADNVYDMLAKGRHRVPFGEHHGMSRLTEVQVSDIRNRRASGESGKSIAEDLGISQQLVYAIHKRRIWKHVAATA